MIGLTKRSHVAPKMLHATFCDSIVLFDWCRTNRIDSVCGVTWIPLCAKDGSVIRWGRGEGETLSHHVVSTQCEEGFSIKNWVEIFAGHFISQKLTRDRKKGQQCKGKILHEVSSLQCNILVTSQRRCYGNCADYFQQQLMILK